MIRLVEAFFSAILLFNAIPHLAQGICGESHMIPFGVGSVNPASPFTGQGFLGAG